jgi:mono/diheme cytochrome c family protein
MPRTLILIALVLASLTLVPLSCLMKVRTDSAKRGAREQIVPDMDAQPKFKTQAENAFFADGRAMRLPVAGTVARGRLEADSRRFRGVDHDTTYTTAFPLPVTEELLARGQERFRIYCAPCHGLGGAGDGMVHKRAESLQQGTWTPPSDLASPTVVARANGHLFHTITAGIRNMPAYGSQIPVDDRWAIVAYVRALQRARNATLADVPEDARRNLR